MTKSPQILKRPFVLLIMLWMGACAGSKSKIDLNQWNRVESLWTSPTGHAVYLFEQMGALSHRKAIVCDTRSEKVLKVLPPDTFPLVSGDTLNVFNLGDRVTPGWYKITRNHSLNWWQRNVYTGEPLGGWETVKAPEWIPTPAATERKTGFTFRIEAAS